MVQDTPAPRQAVQILIVEDSAGDAEIIALELEEAAEVNFQVEHVTRLSQAKARLERGGVQAVLLDLGLPDSQGMDTFELARASANHVPIIVLTGLDDEKLGVRAVQAGAQDYLVKGQVSSQLLARSIRYAVEREQARRKIQLLNTELEQRVVERTRELEASNHALHQANEELKALDRMKTSFIRVTTHELTTPVQVMGGMLGVLGLMKPGQHDRFEEALGIARKGADRLQRMVTRVLEVAQAGAYRQPVQRDLIQPAMLVRQVRDQVAPFAALRNLQLRLNLEEALPDTAINTAQIRDVLLNLVMNAIKFTPDNGEIVISATNPTEQELLLCVEDSGTGIPDVDQPHIFDQFFSSFDTLHHASGEFEFGRRGIGLGLTIAKEFVELHGGTLWLERSSEEGSCFCFTLPAS